MLDPAATISTRVWTSCPHHDDPGWVYLLGYDVGLMWCQCGCCEQRFYWDSGCGVGQPGSHDEQP